jgi:2-(1,2-epoxy-1,2-dihydrophenyl)acetyl-CoA isomerase
MDTISLVIDSGVAHLMLSRPDAANTINRQMSRELREAAVALQLDRTVRAVLLSGEGSLFSGGGDLAAFATADDPAALISEITIDLHAAISRLTKLPAPVVAAVHGAAGGAGMSLVCAADLVLAGESARFTMGYTRVGLVPDGSSTFFLARVVGLGRAMDLMLTNRVLSAGEAEDWGLVSRVVPDDQVLEEGRRLAGALASGPTMAFGAAKRLALAGSNSSLEEAMELESVAIAATVASRDGREGIAAFLEKRAPEFAGG